MANSFLVADTAKNKYISALLKEGLDTTPIQSPWQGASRMAHALLAGLEMRDEERNQREALPAILGIMNGGGAAAPSAAPSVASSRPVAPVDADAVTEAKTPQDYINRAFGMTPQGRDIATRTVLGEAANQGQTGMNAVADVMRNRAVAGGYGGNTMDQVALAKGQFEPWMTQGGRERMAGFSPTGQPYQNAQAAVDTAAIGGRPDVTGGAHYFYAPKAQAQLAQVDGRPVVPSFAAGREPTAVVGAHNFYAPKGQTAQSDPQAAQAQIPQPGVQNIAQAQGISPAQRAQLEAMSRHPNPLVRQYAAGIAQQIVANQFKPSEYDIKHEGGMIIAVDKKNPNNRMVVNDPAIADAMVKQKAAEKYAETSATKRAERDVVRPERERQEQRQALITIDSLNRAEDLVKGETTFSPATGFTGGQVMSNVGGTRAHDVSELVKTAKSATSIQQLNEMRQASPTGGAVGNVTEGEHKLLQSVFGSLEQSQTQDQFLRNLKTARQIYMDVINGTSVIIPRDAAGRPKLDEGGRVVGRENTAPSRKTSTGVTWSVD